MASGGIPQTPTRLSAIALGRSNVVLINAANRSRKFLSGAEGLKCLALRGCLGNPLGVSLFQGFGLYHNITLEIPVGRSFGQSGAKHSRKHKNRRNFSAGQVAKKWHARARSTCKKLPTIGGSIWL
jgi:hypothetical protein